MYNTTRLGSTKKHVPFLGPSDGSSPENQLKIKLKILSLCPPHKTVFLLSKRFSCPTPFLVHSRRAAEARVIV